MKIKKYKKLGKLKYRVFFDNGREIELYEDIILKHNLLLKRELNEEELSKIIKINNNFSAYYVALKYLKIRLRSKKEMNNFLMKKGYSQNIIKETVFKLENEGYLNDLVFAKSFVTNKIITTSNGPLRITKYLLQHGISKKIINLALEEYSDELQMKKIKNHVNRMIKSNKSMSNIYLKRRIYVFLNNEGFKQNLIEDAINDMELKDDSDIARKEYDKLYKKLSGKYIGKNLEIKIKQKLYKRGFYYDK